jgi:hypothetical protein
MMMTSKLAAGMTALCLFACGGGADPEARTAENQAPLTEASAAAATATTPGLPPLQYFGRWDGKTPYFGPTTRRATLLIFASPDEPRGHFRAYGVDSLSGRFTFQVDGLNSSLYTFKNEINRENQINETSATPQNPYANIIASQGPSLPPHIGPTGYPLASAIFNAAVGMEAAHQSAY